MRNSPGNVIVAAAKKETATPQLWFNKGGESKTAPGSRLIQNNTIKNHRHIKTNENLSSPFDKMTINRLRNDSKALNSNSFDRSCNPGHSQGTPAVQSTNPTVSITISDNQTSIGKREFENHSNLTEITIPLGVTHIDEYAFKNCMKLTEITIPNSVTFIGKGAFGQCINLKHVTLSNSLTKVPQGAFFHCISLTNINLPESVTQISDQAFFGCSSLQNVSHTNNVTHIGKHAFALCRSLTHFSLPEGLTEIKPYTFYSSALKTITIPFLVTFIRNKAFSLCKQLQTVNFSNYTPTIHPDAFSDSPSSMAIVHTPLIDLNIPINNTSSNIQPGAVAYYTSIHRFNRLNWLHCLNPITSPYSPQPHRCNQHNASSFFHSEGEQYNQQMSRRINILCNLLEKFEQQAQLVANADDAKSFKSMYIRELISLNMKPEHASTFSALILLNMIFQDENTIPELLPNESQNNLKNLKYLSILYQVIKTILNHVKHFRHGPVDWALEAMVNHYFIHWYDEIEKELVSKNELEDNTFNKEEITKEIIEIRKKKYLYFDKVTTLLFDTQARCAKYSKCIIGLLGTDNLEPILRGMSETASLDQISEFHLNRAIEQKIHSPEFFLNRRSDTPARLLLNSLSPCPSSNLL